MTEERERLKARLEEFGVIEDRGLFATEQFPQRRRDKKGGRTVLPKTNPKEDIIMETQTQTQAQPSTTPDSGRGTIQGDLTFMRDHFAKQASWQSQSIRAGAMLVGGVVVVATGVYVGTKLANRSKPAVAEAVAKK